MREISLHLLDLLQNALEAGARHVCVEVEEDYPADRLALRVRDDGHGMDAATVARAADPFFTHRHTRHVGLGLPLLAAAAERAGGCLAIASQPGLGTTVDATFQLSHPDRQPAGDIPTTLLAFMLSPGGAILQYRHRVRTAGSTAENVRVFEFDGGEIARVLGDIPLGHPLVRAWLSEHLAEGEASLWQS